MPDRPRLTSGQRATVALGLLIAVPTLIATAVGVHDARSTPPQPRPTAGATP